MAGLQAGSWRSHFSNALTAVAVLGGVVSILLALLVFTAGTNSNGDHLILKDLALVSFDGIVANNETSEFMVHIHWFVNSFAWEYPQAPEGVPKVGYVSRGIHFSSDIVKDLHKIAADLKLPQESYDCPHPGPWAEHCENVFFEAWRSFATMNGIPIYGWLTWIMLFSALVVCIITIANEWIIRKRPYWMRCRCFIGKRYCPRPTGTKEELEQLDDQVWDTVRLCYWALTAAYFLLPAGHGTFHAIFLPHFMGYIEERMPEGFSMNPRRNMKGEIMMWGAFVASTVSTLCMLVKWRLSRRPKGWMDDQSLGHLERSSGDEPDETIPAAPRGTDSNTRYTD
ncbi:hypothetical protein G7Z17_g3402 [Cylindrodendrum hubeiense]|uniref:Uncharacterized protein n=1 Tax=Cylindrodendrum hubeiense TaxID=595255 RepID=A0A9P5LJE9_9HYPO|nr:hypothetical protein G7Z17_g3402 [Cylindrodendrum hubeiense]